MAYYNTTIYPENRQRAWEKQFVDRLLKAIFDNRQLLLAFNQEAVISSNNVPRKDLSYEELQDALQAIEDDDLSNYHLTEYPVSNELISKVGFSNDDLNITTQLLYHVVLALSLRPLLDSDPDGNLSEIKQIFQNYIDKHPEQEQYVKDETKLYFDHLLSLAGPIICARRRFEIADNSLQTGMRCYDDQSLIIGVIESIRQEVYTRATQVKCTDDINLLIGVLDTCTNVLTNPNEKTIQDCIEKGNSLSNHSLAKTLGGLVLTLVGVLVLSISVMVAVESFGVAAPLTALGFAFGESLICGSLAGGSALLSTGAGAYGSYTLFKHAPSNPLSDNIHILAKEMDMREKEQAYA